MTERIRYDTLDTVIIIILVFTSNLDVFTAKTLYTYGLNTY